MFYVTAFYFYLLQGRIFLAKLLKVHQWQNRQARRVSTLWARRRQHRTSIHDKGSIYLSTAASRPALRLTSLQFKGVMQAVCQGVERLGCEADHSAPSRTREIINLLPAHHHGVMLNCFITGTNLTSSYGYIGQNLEKKPLNSNEIYDWWWHIFCESCVSHII
jgi:thiaminase